VHVIVLVKFFPSLAPVTVYRAARRRLGRHKTIARWTLPVWMYGSVTGVIIYLMLYHWYAHAYERLTRSMFGAGLPTAPLRLTAWSPL